MNYKWVPKENPTLSIFFLQKTNGIQMDPVQNITPRKSQRDTTKLSKLIANLEIKSNPFATAKKYDEYDKYKNVIIAESQSLTPLFTSQTYKELIVEFERWLISKDISCKKPSSALASARSHIVSAKNASLLLDGKTSYEPSVQRALECFSDSIFEWGSEPQSQKLIEIYNKWVVESLQLGRATTGSVHRFSFDDNPLFAVKVPLKENEKISNLSHEAIVGIYGLNPLKAIVPNFMHVYSSFTCSPPLLSGKITEINPKKDTRPVFSLCPADTPGAVTHLVIENIQESVTMGRWIKNTQITPSHFLQVYLQVINALRVAYNFCDYTHYDLHQDNVMIQEKMHDYVVPFFDSKGEHRYIRTRLIPRIIDYGSSHVEIDGVDFGTVLFDGQEEYGVYTTNSFPMHDAYRFLYASYVRWLRAGYKDPSTKDEMILLFDELYSFFGIDKDDPDDPGAPGGYILYEHESAHTDQAIGSPTICGKATYEMFLEHILQQPTVSALFLGLEAKVDDIRPTDVDTECSNSKCLNPLEIDELLHGDLPTSLGQYNEAVQDLEYFISKANNATTRNSQVNLLRTYSDYEKFLYLFKNEYNKMFLFADSAMELEDEISDIQTNIVDGYMLEKIGYLEKLLLFKSYTRQYAEIVNNIKFFLAFHKKPRPVITDSLSKGLAGYEAVLESASRTLKDVEKSIAIEYQVQGGLTVKNAILYQRKTMDQTLQPDPKDLEMPKMVWTVELVDSFCRDEATKAAARRDLKLLHEAAKSNLKLLLYYDRLQKEFFE